MRSRSSLLAHILGSNPEICGYSELHQNHTGLRSFLRMRAELYSDLKYDFHGKYLLDKILGEYTVHKKIMESPVTKIIFLLREPAPTIRSIINMSRLTGRETYNSPKKAGAYYCSRLRNLKHCADTFTLNSLLIDSEQLLDNTEPVLDALTDWLELKKPLAPEYRTFKKTGKRISGDPSSMIKTGSIQKDRPDYDIGIPDAVLQKATEAFQLCRSALQKSSVIVK